MSQIKTGVDCDICRANGSLSDMARHIIYSCESGHDYSEEIANMAWVQKSSTVLRDQALELLDHLPEELREVARLRVLRYAIKLESDGWTKGWNRGWDYGWDRASAVEAGR